MTKDQFEHVVRAAAAVLGVDEVLVLGSQAIHGSIADALPEEAERSVEVDIAVFGDTDGSQADVIDGSIGEASMFHATFGYYAQGVIEGTARLPLGWKERLVRYESPGTGGAVAWCLERHDLWIAKAVAHRPRDLEYCRVMLDLDIVDRKELRQRLRGVPHLEPEVRSSVERMLNMPGA